MPSFKFDGFVGATLVTNSRKLAGQDHRCSDNFHFHSIKQGKNIRWEIEGGDSANITFDVKEDISGRTDPTIYKSLKNGDINALPKGDSIYIANVKQNGSEIAKNYSLKITVSVV